MAQDKYKIQIKFKGFKNDGTYNMVEPLEFSVKTKKDLIKELNELNIENDETISHVIIYDVAQRIEAHYPIWNGTNLSNIKKDFNIR